MVIGIQIIDLKRVDSNAHVKNFYLPVCRLAKSKQEAHLAALYSLAGKESKDVNGAIIRKICRQKRKQHAVFRGKHSIVAISLTYLHKIASVASFAYYAPAFFVSMNAGGVFWDVPFRSNKMRPSVNACQNIFIPPKQISVLVSHEALYRNRGLHFAVCKQDVVL